MTEKLLEFPRVMIAAPHGRTGKTVVVSGLLRALRNRGIVVQPFKKGPDYIDPGWHSVAAGRASRNLDSFFMDASTMRSVLAQAGEGAEIGVIEGAMGLYDGSDLEGSSSSAEVAKQTSTPVILVIDVDRMTRSAAALVLGFIDFDPDVHIAGVIVNHAVGKRHQARVREAIEHFCHIPVLGCVPQDDRLILPDRHLGLVTTQESPESDAFLEQAASIIEERIDVDGVLEIARSAPAFEAAPIVYPRSNEAEDDPPVVIGVVRDSAFSFYYQENLDALEAAGAELVFLNSLEDGAIPERCDGLYIGGGFPEMFAGQLERNAAFRESVRQRIDDGMACCAECGGLMYLGCSLEYAGATYQMAGAFDFDAVMEEKRQGHGYSFAKANENHPWLSAGTVIKGHEHHHSHLVLDEATYAYDNARGLGIKNHNDGICKKRTVASYTHVNALASPQWALGFVDAARQFHSEQV